MSVRDRRCPDCGVTMADVTLTSGGYTHQSVTTGEKRDGLLGKLGMDDNLPVNTVMCPECGLLRLYAAVDE